MKIPTFELYGPPCKIHNCNGVLVSGFKINDKTSVQTCSVCKTKFDKDGNIILPDWK
jgi:hypothetical protein